MIVASGHTASTEWKSDSTSHWHECTGCEGQQLDKANHTDADNNGKCDVCGATVSTIPVNPDNLGSGGEPNEKKGLSGGAIAGIAVGSVAVAGVGGFALFWFVIKKKKWADLVALFKTVGTKIASIFKKK